MSGGAWTAEPVVILRPRLAALAAHFVELGVRADRQRNGSGPSREVEDLRQLLAAAAGYWAEAAEQVRSAAVAVDGGSRAVGRAGFTMLSVSDAAGELGLQPRSVRYLAQQQLLVGEKAGRVWWFTAAEVAEYGRQRSQRMRDRS